MRQFFHPGYGWPLFLGLLRAAIYGGLSTALGLDVRPLDAGSAALTRLAPAFRIAGEIILTRKESGA